jgi:DNA-binding transcriptional LysR family regulator
MQQLPWDDVRSFLAVASAGSLSAAARTLRVEHSTLSRRMTALEQRLGLNLFRRTRDGVELSPAGAEVLTLAQAAEERMLLGERKLDALTKDRPRVRLATSSILASGLLAPHVGELVAAHSELGLELVVSRGLVRLSRGEADLALRLRPPGAYVAEPSVIVSVLARVGWAAYARGKAGEKRGTITLSGPTQPGRAWLDARRGSGRSEIVVDDVPTALALARDGTGAAVLPCFLADEQPRLSRRSELLDEHRLILAVSRDLRRIEPQRTVIQWLRQVASTNADRLAGSR